jgi:hypothetical protein
LYWAILKLIETQVGCHFPVSRRSTTANGLSVPQLVTNVPICFALLRVGSLFHMVTVNMAPHPGLQTRSTWVDQDAGAADAMPVAAIDETKAATAATAISQMRFRLCISLLRRISPTLGAPWTDSSSSARQSLARDRPDDILQLRHSERLSPPS